MTTPLPPLLQVEGLAKAFGGNRVLQDVSFNIDPGEIVGLLGPNGSGKSTLLNTVSGFEIVDRGQILLRGQGIESLSSHRIVAAGLGRTFQLPSMPTKMSVMEVAMAAATARHGFWDTLLGTPGARAAETAARAKAGALLDELLLSHVRDLPASGLSGGQKKLLGIVCALMGDPQLLMLDEPTAGVHPNLRRDIVGVLQRLNRQGMTLVIVEHDMHFIREVCTRCIVLDRGQIVARSWPAAAPTNSQATSACCRPIWAVARNPKKKPALCRRRHDQHGQRGRGLHARGRHPQGPDAAGRHKRDRDPARP